MTPPLPSIYTTPAPPTGREVHCPPGITPWGWMGGQSKDAAQWTGVYVVTILVAYADYTTVSKCLPKRLHADEALLRNGQYPVVLLFGCVSDAMNRVYDFVGLNYLEVFSAIPGVSESPPSATGGACPFLYPYRGYLNRLTPCILGWLCGYPKRWANVRYRRLGLTSAEDGFEVTTRLGRRPLVSASFESSIHYEFLREFRPNVEKVLNLISPNIIHETMLGSGFAKSAFDIAFLDSAVAWDLPNVSVEVHDSDLFPGMAGKHQWKGLMSQEYGAARFVVPWRLVPQQSQNFQETLWPPPGGFWKPLPPAPPERGVSHADD